MEKTFNKKNKRLFEYQTSIQLEGQFLIQWIHPSLYNCLPNLKKDGILRDSPTSVDADIFDDTFTQRFRYWLLPHLTRLK